MSTTDNTQTAVRAVLILDTAVQVALFNGILRENIINAGGRWAGPNPKGHADIFKDMEVRVKADGEETGCNVALLKNNYNFNDSGWTNQAPVLEKLSAIAREANGGKDMVKRDIVANLEHIKDILKKATKAVPAKAKAASAAPATPPAQTPTTENAEDEQTIGAAAAVDEAQPETKKPAGKTNKAA